MEDIDLAVLRYAWRGTHIATDSLTDGKSREFWSIPGKPDEAYAATFDADGVMIGGQVVERKILNEEK